VILFGYSGYTFQRNFAWKNNLTLSETDIITAPENVIINGVLANMLFGEAAKNGFDPELLERSAYHYEKAVKMNPVDWKRTNNLGLVYQHLNEHRKAALAFRKARAYESSIQGKAHFSEARSWYLAQDYRQALIVWMEVDKAYPNNADVAFNMALTFEALNLKEKSIHYYQRVLDLTRNPNISAADPSIIEKAKAKVAESQ
jgi:tetratricopeptide (TPR) repeat protein